MELWVRSQDKKRLISVTNLYIPISRNGEDFSIYTFDTDVELGIYKTEERALEVLDEIEDEMRRSKKLYDECNGYTDYFEPETGLYKNDNLLIFQMPKE